MAALGAACMAASVSAQRAAAPDPLDGLELPVPSVHEARLDNGLRVVVEEDPARPRVAVLLRYAVGSGDDPPDHSGLAHLTEHCMFEGGRHLAPRAVFRLLARAGALSMNATTHVDHTDYYSVIPPRNLELALWLEAQRLGSLLEKLDRDAFVRARSAVLAEWRTKRGRAAASAAGPVLADALFPPGHRYRRRTEVRDEIGRLVLDDVRWFHQRSYRPDRATLVLVGDVRAEEAFALARRHLGGVRPTPAEPGVWEPYPDVASTPPSATAIVVRAPTVESQLTLEWQTPAYLAPGDAALDLAASVIGPTLEDGFEAARLFPRWVGVQQVSAPVASTFVVSVGGNAHDDVEDLLGVVVSQLDRLRDRGPSRDAFAGARADWLRHTLARAEGLLGRAEFLAALAAVGAELVPLTEHEVARYRAVTRAAVHAAIRDHLRPDARVLLRIEADREAPINGEVVARVGGRW